VCRYAQVAARNSEQTPEEASAPAPPQIIPTESLSASDIASVSTGTGGSLPDDSYAGPGGIHVIDRSEVAELNTSDGPVVPEPGPSITVNPIVFDESDAADSNGLRGKRTRRLSEREKQVAVFGGVGSVNVLAVGLIGYFGYKRYAAGENGWRILGIAVGTFAGISAVQYLGVRYDPCSLQFSLSSFCSRFPWGD
jgi:hypothetical protein